MPWPRLLPAAIALLVLAAHFYRAGLAWLVPVCAGLVLLLFIRLEWVPRVVGVALVVAGAEWLRTLVLLADARIDAGRPWFRLAAILGGVAIATLLATLPLRSAPVARWYRDRS
jgi:hypothetical protein